MRLLKRALRIAAILLTSLLIVLTIETIAEIVGWALPLAKAE